MKKLLTLFFLLLFNSVFMPAAADPEVHVLMNETYYCGDSFEILFPHEPILTTVIQRRAPGGSNVTHAMAGKDDILLEIRLQIRNMTPDVYLGLRPDSFTLVGYVRGRPLSYTPEIMEPYDFGGKTSFTLYDKNYYQKSSFAPLRKVDMLLVYRVNPILRDWELHIEPQGMNGTERSYLASSYHDMDLEPCSGVFQFITVREAATGIVIKYYR